MASYQLAQLNIARLKAPIDSPQLADFVANLDRINALAERTHGFVWRLQGDGGDATGIDYFGADVIVNMSVWEDVETLRDYAFASGHVEIMRRRAEWFHKMAEAHAVLWWVPAGHRPSLEEAEERLNHLRANGPSRFAFTFKHAYPAPDALDPERVTYDDTCPA